MVRLQCFFTTYDIRSSLCFSYSLCLHLLVSRSSQCSTTGVTKAVVCAILSVGWYI